MKILRIFLTSWILTIGVCSADSIRIAGTRYGDVYIAEASGRYYVYSKAGERINDVSNKRFDVKDVIIDREDPERKEFFKKLRDDQSKTADGDLGAIPDPGNSDKALADSYEATRKKREKYDELMKNAAKSAQARKPLLEKAAIDAQKREAERPHQEQIRLEQDKARWAAESKRAPQYQAPVVQAPSHAADGTVFDNPDGRIVVREFARAAGVSDSEMKSGLNDVIKNGWSGQHKDNPEFNNLLRQYSEVAGQLNEMLGGR